MPIRTRRTYQPQPTFDDLIAKAGLSKAQLARDASISEQTIHAMLNPSTLATRRGGVRPATAYKIAGAFGRHTGLSLEDSIERLFTANVREEQM